MNTHTSKSKIYIPGTVLSQEFQAHITEQYKNSTTN